MNRRLDDLLLRRGRLIERIAGQRADLRRDFEPLVSALGKVDLACAGARRGAEYLRRHALATSVVAGFFLIFKGRTALRWGGRAFSLWRSWRALRGVLFGLEDRLRP
ncbi:MAG: YqjK-like family protein [Candidatus Accumulibacter sp.]|jgi:hypothetical protein|nr:YqjK-like family protein [Accumulibacter sp.]